MIPERIKGLLEQAEVWIAAFKKETYEESFQKYVEEYRPVWDTTAAALHDDRLLQEQEEERARIAEAFVQGARGRLDAVSGRTKKEKLQYEMNLYMVTYVLPALLCWENCGGRQKEETKRLTDMICGRWQEAFGARIQAADYEVIRSGFKQKLCFVTTAVCRGLNKPADCREIKLMKQFRDGYFSRNEEGRRLIGEYYDIAPTIVKRIAREANPGEKYLYLWNTYIRKCVDLISRDENERCGRLYRSMMAELKEEYMVTDRRGRE